jgi:hypothetical protein
MKFILILNICSAVHLNCLPPIEYNFVFNSWQECANAGYLRAIQETNKMDSGIVNRNRVVVNFACQSVEET